jgi:hypothetical protein
MAYDAVHGQAVVLGGWDASTTFATDAWTYRYQSFVPATVETCQYGLDGDGDDLVGCADPDCFGACTPLCNPTIMTCDPSWPHCGDGTCQAVETARLCPADCGAPTPVCGDFICESLETIASCPGDCP